MLKKDLGGSSRMTMYNVSEVRNNDAYSIDGAALNSQVASQNLEQVEFMYNEGVPEFVVDQNIYYPAATNYGYYCTGFEPPGEWDEHNRIYGLEGPDVHYTGVQNENVPYVYYTQSYGYAQSAYNPYNPYIPGAMLGVDGSLVGVQQYYTLSPYQNPVASPAHVPVVQPDITPNNSLSYFFDDLSVNKPDGRGSRHNCASGSNPFGRHPSKAVASHSLPKMLEGPSPNAGVMQSSINGGVSANGFLSSASSNVFKDAGSKVRSKVHMEKAMVSVKGSSGTLFEQNRGPRTNRSKNQLLVKSYGASMGGASEHENIVIYADQYNGDDFLIEYKNAKFFVIKSYSEDDVHKSIKYNVWSSTLHGNKKLNNAYKDAQTIVGGESGGCPIFLFFSVNASGQFCGVAEMVGPVDYGKDMDFWQQDKWNGCFPVKWHIIKDVSNGSFRHIVLENNENKPVTNSRDTQEIMFKKGLEMLKVFKSHTLKTSILDDFMYYENRQKIILEEKAKLLGRSFERPVCAPKLDSRKLNFPSELPHRVDKVSHNDPNSFEQLSTSTAEKVSSNCDVTDAKLKSENSENVVAYKDNQLSNLKIGSLTISSKEVETNLSPVTSAGLDNIELIDVLTVGSMSVKLNGFKKPSGNLTFGTIPFDPRPWQAANNAASPKNGS